MPYCYPQVQESNVLKGYSHIFFSRNILSNAPFQNFEKRLLFVIPIDQYFFDQSPKIFKRMQEIEG